MRKLLVADRGEKLDLGLIGAGWVANARYLPALKRDRRVRVSALLDSDAAVARQVAARRGIPRFQDNLDDFLALPLDAVVITTPPGTHADLIEAALGAGKHVLVEKPMTLTADAGKRLAQQAESQGLVLCPAHSFLFSRSLRQADAFLASGRGGEVQGALGLQLSSYRRRLPAWYPDLPGGLAFDEAPHLLYLMQHFLGELTLEARWHQGPDAAHQITEAKLRGPRGGGYLNIWLGAPFSEWLFTLYCSRAVLVIDLFRDLLLVLPPETAHRGREVLAAAGWATARFWRGLVASGWRSLGGRLLFGHDCLVSAFIDAVFHGKPSPVAAADGWRVVALAEQIWGRPEAPR